MTADEANAGEDSSDRTHLATQEPGFSAATGSNLQPVNDCRQGHSGRAGLDWRASVLAGLQWGQQCV